MRLNKSKVTFMIALLMYLCGSGAFAQTYPSGLVTVLTNQRTLFLDEYTDPFLPRIRTTIYFTDFSESSWQFCLRLRITGPGGLVITSKPGAKPAIPLNIAPGQPYILEGADLAYYFNYDNLDFVNISRAQLQISHRLPEGLYSFCFEAIDYESGRALSHPSCASAYLSLSDPPLITSPACGSVIENIALQNILFQWQRGNANGNAMREDIRYTVRLYEVNNSWVNPYTAILNNQALPIWESQPLQTTSYLYTNIDPSLEKGKRYVFAVKADEQNGRSSFKNNGYSMPCYFHYGYTENDTIQLIRPVQDFQFTLGTASEFRWKRPVKALPSQMISYTLKLVPVDSLQDPEDAIVDNLPFFQQTYLANTNQMMEKTIPIAIWANIRRMGKYAWQVYARSGNQDIAKSSVFTFTGPPEIEYFIAGGFLMQVTRLTDYDKTNQVISGTCRTTLNSAWGNTPTEFSFSNISITAIGNNEWVMHAGQIRSAITTPDYTLSPRTFAENKQARFSPDSILVNTSGVKLSGHVHWTLPHPGSSGHLQTLTSRRCHLTLANQTFYLNNNTPVYIADHQTFSLAEPAGFSIHLNPVSNISIYESKYEMELDGFVHLPSKVNDASGNNCQLSIRKAAQLHYIREEQNNNSSALRLSKNTGFAFAPKTYVIDLDETRSPGTFAQDSTWKGVYIETAALHFPAKTEISGQLSMPLAQTFTFANSEPDSNVAYITHKGLYLQSTTSLSLSDSLKFNGFTSKQAIFHIRSEASEIANAFIQGGILIPVIDTARSFPYRIELGDEGFNEGYLVNGLQNTTFTFNPAGSAEEKIDISIQRALFAGRNRLELDMELHWPFFQLRISDINKFSIWGNGNIGFNIPNGKTALTMQAQGRAGNFDITVDNIGCGRNGNAYAMGASAKINMDEEISGETGPPVMNAYSIYKNSLLTGMVMIPASPTLQPTDSLNNGNTYQSSTSQYTNATASGLAESLGQLGFDPRDTLSLDPNADAAVDPLLKGDAITEIKKIIDIIYRLKPFIPPGKISEKDWMVLDRFRRSIENDVIKRSEVTNAKGLLNFMLTKVVEGVIMRINQPISDLSAAAVMKVREAVNNYVTNPINNKVDQSLNAVFSRLEQNLIAYAGEEHQDAIKTVLQVIRQQIGTEIKNSVSASFEQNITGRVAQFVELGVAAKIKNFVRKEVSGAGEQLIQNGANASISLSNIINNAHTVFKDIADTIKHVIINTNGASFVNTAESIAEDAISGIDWNAVSARIMNELISKGVSQLVATQVSDRLKSQAGPFVAAALNTVKFDFSNLGEKLQNGEFDKIVKFDPTTIYIVSPACDIRGTLRFTKNDPVFGDSWQSDVYVKVKVPKKDNQVECRAFFLNGKTTQQPQNFTYWFAKLGVRGLNIPLDPVPLAWDGADGFAYSKMKKTGDLTVLPDNTNKFGLGVKMFFQDDETRGSVLLLALGAEATFNQGGFAVELTGDVSAMNYLKADNKYVTPGFITGTGRMGYYKTESVKKVAGNFSVKLNTEPLLCAGGDLGFDIRSPQNWKVWIGTQENPIGAKILCKDFLSNTAYLEVANSGFKAGLRMNVDINAQSPWIELSAIKVRGYASLNFGYSANTSISWEPQFVINEAGISAWASAAIGVEYESAGVSNNLTLAGVNLSGSLLYKSKPESELHGEMSGSITVIGYQVGFNTPVHYSLSQQKIIN